MPNQKASTATLDQVRRVLGRSTVYANKWIRLVETKLEVRDSEPDNFYHVEGPADLVSVLAITSKGRVLLVEQYRFAVDAVTLDLPGGAAEPGEVPQLAASRELLEETGYEAGHIQHLASYFIDSGQKNSIKHLFLARNVTKFTEEVDPAIMRVVEVPFSCLLESVTMGRERESSLITATLLAASLLQ